MKKAANGRVSLYNFRKTKQYSQMQMASIIGISRSFYTQLENGSRKPSLETALKISKLIDCDLREWS